MGRKNKKQLAKEAIILKQNQRQAALFFNPRDTKKRRPLQDISANENGTPDMLAALPIGIEKLKSFGKTQESAENFNSEFTAASSSVDPVGPPAKKVKVELPHTREHGGKTYHLSDYGLKNYNKLLENNQLERGVPDKECQECKEVMDWKVDGPIKKSKGVRWYTYQPRHNGKCRTDNKAALAFDKELKEIDSKLVVLNSKKEKVKADLKQITDLTARRAICFEKGKHSKSKKADDDARATGMCPGRSGGGACPHQAKAPIINGRQKIYCSHCQDKVAANNDNVLESQRKAAERAENIFVTVPHSVSLKSLGADTIRKLIPATSVWMLQKDIVGIDTSSAGGKGSCDWEDLNGVGGFYISSGIHHTFHAKRTYAAQERSIESKWSISIDGAAPHSFLFIPMLKSFAKWCTGRVICYHTAQAECDFKRLTSVFTQTTAAIITTGSPFPHFETGWLNTGQDIYRHLIGPKNVPVLSTHWKLSILHDEMYSLKSDPSISIPLDTGVVNIPDVTNVVSDAMKTWNLAMLMNTILF